MPGGKQVIWGMVILVLAGLALVVWQRFSGPQEPLLQEAVYTVRSGPLTIDVVESGTIKAREQLIIKNEVEGKTSILYLIPEGTQVKKGDLLVELDASALMDAKIDQEIKVQNARAAFVNATENMAVVENQAQSDLDLAELTLEFARQDLKKYTDGEYPNELQKANAEITLAQEELARARERLEWSKTLYEEKFISQTELAADELAEKKKDLDLSLAKNNLELLVNYTSQRDLAQRKSDVSQAEMALERTRRKARADVVQAGAELKAREAEFQRQNDRLEKILTQLEKTRIVSPADGLVIYATSAQGGMFRRNTEPLQEGQDIRERQELIYLPTASSSNAEIAIHESNLKKVSKGMPAKVTVDALPGREFSGRITHIAPLPDAQSIWMNPDLKVFTTQIFLDGNDSDIRTGMSCQAQIIIETHDNVVSVPVQAVLQVHGVPTVYVRSGGGFVPRQVDIGLDNNRMIHVKNGLAVGDIVLLTPPLADAEKKVFQKTGTESLEDRK
ncbi:MAG: efflux RND transporter periplasmic adaptor subunit [Desulfotignum sp.]|nr:efflux RND transporter periplasmic adaptor subunit [Desulfotignum sp.]